MSLAPFVPMGSLTAWTSTSWPRSISSWMRRPWRGLPFELGDDDLVHVEEPVLLEPDFDERRLHSREDVVDNALVDVPRHRAVRGAAEIDLHDDAVLEDGDSLLGHLDRDEDLLLDLGESRALRRLRAPAARLRGVLAFLRLPRARRARLGLRFRPLHSVFAPPSAAPTPSSCSRPRPPRVPRRRRGFGFSACPSRLGRRGLLERLGSGRLDGRRLLGALLAKQSHGRKSPFGRTPPPAHPGAGELSVSATNLI